jgi:hypothetical protein
MVRRTVASLVVAASFVAGFGAGAAGASGPKTKWTGQVAQTVGPSQATLSGTLALTKGSGPTSITVTADVSPTTSTGFCGPVSGVVDIASSSGSTATFTFLSKWGEKLTFTGQSAGITYKGTIEEACESRTVLGILMELAAGG